MRPVRDQYTDDGLTVVEDAAGANPWPFIFIAAVIVLLAVGGSL